MTLKNYTTGPWAEMGEKRAGCLEASLSAICVTAGIRGEYR